MGEKKRKKIWEIGLVDNFRRVSYFKTNWLQRLYFLFFFFFLFFCLVMNKELIRNLRSKIAL